MKFSKLVTSVFLFVSSVAMAGEYKLDESHTQVGFKIKHLVISTVSGRFNKFSGGFRFDSLTGKLENLKVAIEATSIDTNEPERDKHLRSKDFFDVEKFKAVDFISTDVVYKDKKPTEIKGTLTIHGISKPIVLKVEFKGEATDPWGNQTLAFEASSVVDRKDFGLNWNKNLDKGGVMIADDVKILIEGEALLQKSTK